MKAQALTQALVTGFGVMIIIILIIVLNNNSLKYREFTSESDTESVCILVKKGIAEIQPLSNYRSATDTISGSVLIDFPEKIGNSEYRISFSGKNITIETMKEPKKEYSCNLGFDLAVEGSTNGGKTTMVFVASKNSDRVVVSK